MDDYFAVFGLPRKLELDPVEIQRRFYELSRQHHPDFHHSHGASARAEALETSALVNRAYRALRDPLTRVEYLIALEEGRETREGEGDGGKPRAPKELLEQMLEVQEALEEARAAGLPEESKERLRQERDRLLERQAGEERAILGRARDWDAIIEDHGDRRRLIEWFKQRLATRAYLRTVIGDVTEVLGDETDVSHRRH